MTEETFEVEFGSDRPIKVAKTGMYDSAGKEVLCNCGKSAGSAIIGKKAFQAFCEECSPISNYSANLIYKDPSIDLSDPAMRRALKLFDEWIEEKPRKLQKTMGKEE